MNADLRQAGGAAWPEGPLDGADCHAYQDLHQPQGLWLSR